MSKKLQAAFEKVTPNKIYELDEAIKLAQETSYTKFDGSIDLAINLNLDVRKAEQQLRGSISLPNGTGKTVRVLVVTNNNEELELAKKAKADFAVSFEELKPILAKGKYDFDVIVADPKIMPMLGKYGKSLGPKGLMPNPKTNTISATPSKLVAELKKGKANYRTDKNGILHVAIGKVSFSTEKLTENAKVLLNAIKRLRPSVVKGNYFLNITVSASMGPSVKIKIEK